MPGHSSIVGGSTADRILNCPGSYQALLALPPAADRPSEYAEEGTFCHAVMAELFNHREICEPDIIPDLYLLARGWADEAKFFHDRALTHEHVDSMILPALLALAELEALYGYGGGFIVEAVEKSVKFPNIPGAFGTCDLILSSDSHILHVDWKFGQGIPVLALYPDPAGDIVNPQLLFYITAAMSSARHFYSGRKKLVGAIIQPRSDTPLSHTEISRKEVKWFAQDLEKSVITAMERDPPRKKGEWCRFAGCKVSCPLWTKPMLELATLPEMARTEMATDQVSEYGNYLSRAKTLVDIVSIFKKELDEQLHAYLEDGGMVPGWRLKAKAKQRQWIDDKIVVPALKDLGFSADEIWQKKLQTFASADATAKRYGVEIPDHLRQAPSTNETTICRTDDPAPEVHKPLAIEQFRAALAALKSA